MLSFAPKGRARIARQFTAGIAMAAAAEPGDKSPGYSRAVPAGRKETTDIHCFSFVEGEPSIEALRRL